MNGCSSTTPFSIAALCTAKSISLLPRPASLMLREGLSRRPLAIEGFDGGRGRGAFRRKFVLARIRLLQRIRPAAAALL